MVKAKTNSWDLRHSLYDEIAKSGDQAAICIMLVNPRIDQFIKDELFLCVFAIVRIMTLNI